VRGRSFDNIQGWYTVDAYEDVAVPAGTFKVFRVTSQFGQTTKNITWFSPDLGISVKTVFERTSQFYTGPGIRETQLLSQDIKK
jgi:hypothetical protein